MKKFLLYNLNNNSLHAYRLFFILFLDCGVILCINTSSVFFYVVFFYYYYFPFSHNFFFFFLHFYLEIYYSILCGTLKSHTAFVRLVHHFVWVFMCFSNAKRIAVSSTHKKTHHKNILEKVISTYNHYYGYYKSKNGEKKAPRKDTQTSVVMGWLLTKTTIMCAHKRSHE